MKKDKILQSDITTRKNFSYTLNNCRLAFSLRTDIKQELKDFKELLSTALKEVSEEIELK